MLLVLRFGPASAEEIAGALDARAMRWDPARRRWLGDGRTVSALIAWARRRGLVFDRRSRWRLTRAGRRRAANIANRSADLNGLR